MGEFVPPSASIEPINLLNQSNFLIERARRRLKQAALVLIITFVPALASGLTLTLTQNNFDPIVQHALLTTFCGVPVVGGITSVLLFNSSSKDETKAKRLIDGVNNQLPKIRAYAIQQALAGTLPPNRRLN